ncbi:hypothetical protein H4219_001161 [Mycoemilia scoparia]|uniref:Uncharacterized protein n=1 Tax=Mycoemilia scoparia TaxID=417184 RepID=A0A9W8A1C0_9FUNG|nr:hypothetical protein H4219_001161 [Mycoemilia scoparia]
MNEPKPSYYHLEAPEGTWEVVFMGDSEDSANQLLPKLDKAGNANEQYTQSNTNAALRDAAEALQSPAQQQPLNSAGARLGSNSIAIDVSSQTNSTGASTQNVSRINMFQPANKPTHVSLLYLPGNGASPYHIPTDAPNVIESDHTFPPHQPSHDVLSADHQNTPSLTPSAQNGNDIGYNTLQAPKTSRKPSFMRSLRSSWKVGSSPSGLNSGFIRSKEPSALDLNAHANDSKDQNKDKSTNSSATVTRLTSSFIHRFVTHEAIDGFKQSWSKTTFPFGFMLFETSRSLVWAQFRFDGKPETLSRMDMTKCAPVCHAINQVSPSADHIDIAVGFQGGDIMWYDPINAKYSRLNKNAPNMASIRSIRWVPGSKNLFMVARGDGSVLVIDKTKDDWWCPPQAAIKAAINSYSDFQMFRAHKSKHNPVSYWKLSNKAINDFAFSPDGRYVGLVGDDGALRVVDFYEEKLESVYLSYFGGLTCIDWSPDSQYIITGGKDDLITIWSFYDQTIVARCQGHQSWVTSIAFDPVDLDFENTYRFASVGEDTRLLFWDFSISSLHQPRSSLKKVNSKHAGAAGNISKTTLNAQSICNDGLQQQKESIVHPRVPHDCVAVLQPVMSEEIHDAPLCSLQFWCDYLVTTCRRGQVKFWKRPELC